MSFNNEINGYKRGCPLNIAAMNHGTAKESVIDLSINVTNFRKCWGGESCEDF